MSTRLTDDDDDDENVRREPMNKVAGQIWWAVLDLLDFFRDEYDLAIERRASDDYARVYAIMHGAPPRKPERRRVLLLRHRREG